MQNWSENNKRIENVQLKKKTAVITCMSPDVSDDSEVNNWSLQQVHVKFYSIWGYRRMVKNTMQTMEQGQVS